MYTDQLFGARRRQTTLADVLAFVAPTGATKEDEWEDDLETEEIQFPERELKPSTDANHWIFSN